MSSEWVGSEVDIVTVQEALDFLGASEDDEAEVGGLVTMASEFIERVCRSYFAAREKTLVLDGTDSPLLDVGGPFIVTEAGSEAVTLTVEVGGVAVTDYVALPERGQLYRAARWSTPDPTSGLAIRNVEVTLTVGYDPIPQPVVRACLKIVRAMWRDEPLGSGDLQSERIGEYSYARQSVGQSAVIPVGGTGIPAFVEHLLLPYRRW